MPVLWAYARDLFQTPGFGDTVDFVQIKQHYYIVHADINPTRIVPKGPELANWLTPHGREALGGRPFGDGTPPGRRARLSGYRRATGRLAPHRSDRPFGMRDTVQFAGLVDDQRHQLDGDPGQPPAMRIDGGDGDGQPAARPEERRRRGWPDPHRPATATRVPALSRRHRKLHRIRRIHPQLALRLRVLAVVEVEHIAVPVGPDPGQMAV